MGSPTVIVENKADPSAQRRLRKHYLTLARNNIDLTSSGLFPVDNPTNEISPSESTEPTESVGREWIKRVRKDMALCHRQIRKGMTDEIVVQQMAIIDEHRHACDKRIERANRRFSVVERTAHSWRSRCWNKSPANATGLSLRRTISLNAVVSSSSFGWASRQDGCSYVEKNAP